MQYVPIVTPDLYLAMLGLFAASVVITTLVHAARPRRWVRVIARPPRD